MKNIFSLFLLLVLSGYTYASDIVSGKTYKVFMPASGNKSLTVRNSSLASDAEVITWTETNVNAQRWIVSADNENKYQFANAYTGKILYRKGTATDGAKISQYDKNELSAGKWEILPVDGKQDFYHIIQMDRTGNNRLYLEALNNGEGALLELHTIKSGLDADRQMWKLEEVNAEPNYFTTVVRDEMMRGFRAKYYKKAPSGYVLGNGGWWGDAEMFEVVLDAYETTGNSQHEEMFRQLYINFTSRNGTDWLYNDFNDDIAWMVIASVRAYLMFGDQNYLNNAKNNFDRMYARALLPSGMLRWKESNETINGTNSCINGPAEVAACYLGIATGNEDYYTKAKKLYALQRQYLYVPSTGKVYDSFTWVNGKPSNYNEWSSTYNQGTYLGAAVMLYNHFGDRQYKEDAKMIMKYTLKDLCDAYGIIKVCQVATGDLAGFKGILMRYVRRFIVDMQQTEYAGWMRENAFHAYNNRNSQGVSSSAWLTKAPENFVFENCEKDCSFANDPFGPSTAVSAAFNAPMDDNTIIKDAFSKIEAENFNYLKGVHVKDGSDDNTPDLRNIRNGFWTGYNNIDFGNNLAKSIEIRVSKAEYRGTKIEVRLDSPEGTLLGIVDVPREGDDWQTISSQIAPVSGIRNIYFVYKGLDGMTDILKFNYFRFSTDSYTYPDITDNGGKVVSSLKPIGSDYALSNIIDNKLDTKFHADRGNNPGSFWIEYQSPVPVALKGYSLASADDASDKDPKAWELQASINGKDWLNIDSQSNQIFEGRYQKKEYNISVQNTYTHFRLNITQVNGNTKEFQLAEWQLYGSGLFGNDITADGGLLTTQYDGNGIEKLTDKNVSSIYQVDGQTGFWVEYRANAMYRLTSYSVTSANNAPEKDPKDWILYGSEDGKDWKKVDEQKNQKFLYRNITHPYPCLADAKYRYFKLQVTANNGGSGIQLAEWQLYGGYYFDSFHNDITTNGGKLSSSQETTESGKLKALTDNNGNTVYTLDGAGLPVWIQYESSVPVQLRAYSITAADDENKNPRAWALQGSNDGKEWSNIDSRSNITFSLKGEQKKYPVSGDRKYSFFRLNITRISGEEASEVKIAEWEIHGTGIYNTDFTSNNGSIESEYPGLGTSENVNKLIDKSPDTKFCSNFYDSSWVGYASPVPVKLTAYSITSANDSDERDPRAWILEASNDGIDWDALDSRTGQSFPYRYITQYYACNKDKKEYLYFRLNVTENNSANLLQFAEWQLLDINVYDPVGIIKTDREMSEVSLYPNPSDTYFHVNVPENSLMEIYNISGQLIYTQQLDRGITTVQTGSLSKGNYIVRIKSENKVSVKKFIKR